MGDSSEQAAYDAIFEVGDSVRMVGLRAAAKYNGVTGKVAGLDGADRYVVKLDPGKIELRVRPNNMEKIAADTTPREVPTVLQTGTPFMASAAPNGVTDFTPRPGPPHPTPSTAQHRPPPPQQPVFSSSFSKPMPPDLSSVSILPPQTDEPTPPSVSSRPPASDYSSDPTYTVRPPPPIQRAPRNNDNDTVEVPRAGIHAIVAEVRAPDGERHVLIEDVLEGGQLERKGVRKMDRILQIQGRDVSKLSLRQIQCLDPSKAESMISGKEGTSVDMTLQHPRQQGGAAPHPPFVVEVTRTFSQTADALVMFHEEVRELVQAPLEATHRPALARLPPHLAVARGRLHDDILQLKRTQADLLRQHGILVDRVKGADRDNAHLHVDLKKAEEATRALQRSKAAEEERQTLMARDFDQQLRAVAVKTDLGGCIASLRMGRDAAVLQAAAAKSVAEKGPWDAERQRAAEEKMARVSVEAEVAAALQTDQERVQVIGLRPDHRVVDLILFPGSEQSRDVRPSLELAQQLSSQAEAEGSPLRRSAATCEVEAVEVKSGPAWLSYLRARQAFMEDKHAALREQLRSKDLLLAQAKREMEEMQLEVEEMRREKEELERLVEVERAEKFELQRKNAAMFKEMEKIRRELAEVREEVYHDEVLQTRQRRMEGAEAQQRALLRDLEQLRAESDAQQHTARKAQASADKMREEAQARADEASHSVQKLKDEVETLKRQMSSMQSMFDLETGRREHAEKVRGEIQEELSGLQQGHFQLRVQHEQGKASLREHASRIETLKTREATLREAIKGHERTIEELRKRNAAQVGGVPHVEVQRMLAQHNKDMDEKRARIEELEHRVTEVDTAMANLNREMFEAPLTLEEKSKFEIKQHQHARHHAALTEQLDWRSAEVASLRQQIRSFVSNSGGATLENQKVISEQHRTIAVQQRELEQTKTALAAAQGELEERTARRQEVLEELREVMLREEARSKDPQQWLHRDAGARYRRNERQMKEMVATYEAEVRTLSSRIVQLEAPLLEDWDHRISAALVANSHAANPQGDGTQAALDDAGWQNKMPSLAERRAPSKGHDVSGVSEGVRTGELVEVEVTRGRVGDGVGAESEEERVGVGVFLACPCVVMAIKDGSPAQRTGAIRPGDFLQQIDGVATKGKDGRELSQSLMGAAGSTVLLTLFRMSDAVPAVEQEE